jgi:hypothetical protein
MIYFEPLVTTFEARVEAVCLSLKQSHHLSSNLSKLKVSKYLTLSLSATKSTFVTFTLIAHIKLHNLKLGCDMLFQLAFTACGCVFKVITLVQSNQLNFFENATACSKRTLKTRVAT